tara:strand:+ start:127 stop:969 length:843 start_codon:yes stop_codon:yes gene_type:complete
MGTHNEFWVNGVREDSVSAADRGLEFGDGLFETMRYYQGNIIALDLHLKRLEKGLKRLFFPDNLSRVLSDLKIVIEHLGNLGKENFIVRVAVTRGIGSRGYEPDASPLVNIIIKASAINSSPIEQSPPLTVGTADFRLSIQPVLAGIKHTNRLEQILGSLEKKHKHLDELLLRNIDNIPISFISGNLFIRESKTLLTPILKSNGIEGTRRNLILSQLAADCGYSALERNLSMERIAASDEVIFCNTIHGIRSICRLDNTEWSDYSASRSLHASYVQRHLK